MYIRMYTLCIPCTLHIHAYIVMCMYIAVVIHLALLQWLHGCDHQMLPTVVFIVKLCLYLRITSDGEDCAMVLQPLSFTVKSSYLIH